MPNEDEIFIENVVRAAITKNRELLDSLRAKGLSTVFGNDEFNAAMLLGQTGNEEACDYLAANHSYLVLEDIICGAAYRNNQAFIDLYLEKMRQKYLKPDFKRIALYAARGGHLALAEQFLNTIAESERNYFSVASKAAGDGHQAVAEYFLNKKRDKNDSNYSQLAAYAAERGHRAVAEYFLNKIADESKRNYNWVAAVAAQGGHHALAEYFLNKIADESKRNYNLVAAKAAQGGHHALAEYFLNKITDESKRNYNDVATCAQNGGHYTIAAYFHAKTKECPSPEVKPLIFSHVSNKSEARPEPAITTHAPAVQPVQERRELEKVGMSCAHS